jgi:hypothetical protein
MKKQVRGVRRNVLQVQSLGRETSMSRTLNEHQHQGERQLNVEGEACRPELERLIKIGI